MTLLIGVADAGAAASDSQANSGALATRFQCVADGTVTALALWTLSGSGADTLHLALYADDGSGNATTRLTGDITLGSAVTAGGWSTVTVSPGVSVTNGTFYWIAAVYGPNAATLNFADYATSGGTSAYTISGTTALNDPADWQVNSATAIFALQATGTTGGGGGADLNLACIN